MKTTILLVRFVLYVTLLALSVDGYAGIEKKISGAKQPGTVPLEIRRLAQSNVKPRDIQSKNKTGISYPRYPQSATGGDFVVGTGAKIQLAHGTAVSLGGNFSNTGTFTAGTSTTVVFNGTGSQTLSGVTTFDNLLKWGEGTLTLSSPITVSGALNVVSGELHTASQSISFGPFGMLNGKNVGGNSVGPDSVIGPGAEALILAVADGWNMLSVPVVQSDYSKTTLYPSATSASFVYQAGYVRKDSLDIGTGFWVKFDGTQNVGLIGGTILSDTINVSHGWNMIGSISAAVAASSIGSIPGGIVTSDFFEYANVYQVSDSIRPGKAYWVRVDQDGKLILTSSGLVLVENRIKIQPGSELPPPPPGGAITEKRESIPREFALHQNYPNPFNPTTTIRFDLSKPAHVVLKLYNMLGQEVAVLADGIEDAGYKSVEWNASRVASGVYLYKLQAGTFSDVRKLILLR